MKSIVDYFSFDQQTKSITHSKQKHDQALMPNLNDKSGSRKRPMDMFAPTYSNLLESQQKGTFGIIATLINPTDKSHDLYPMKPVKMLIWSGTGRGGMKRKQATWKSKGLKKSSCKIKWNSRRRNMQSNMNLKKKSGIVNWN